MNFVLDFKNWACIILFIVILTEQVVNVCTFYHFIMKIALVCFKNRFSDFLPSVLKDLKGIFT